MKSRLFAIVSLLLISAEVHALKIDGKALESGKDLAQSKDHVMLGRMPGSWIVQYEAKEFDQMKLALGKSTANQSFEKIESVEGRVTRVGYALPAGRSSFEGLRQYEAELQKKGFKRMYGCEGQACGPLFHHALVTLPGEQDDFYYYDLETDTLHYAAWKLARPQGDVYVMLTTFAPNSVRQVPNSFAFVRVAEVKGMTEELVVIDAAEMQKGIATEGHVALYGILFDFNKADLKPESKPTLDEIASLLKKNPQWKIYVVGHTDNVGTFEYNMDLSQRRAKAVVGALTGSYGIEAARMRGTGVGPVAPVTLNETEEGRAKNRRVELVKQ